MERTVVLDRSAFSKKLRHACNLDRSKSGVHCIFLPAEIPNAVEDKVVAEFGITNGYLTLTLDTTFILETAETLAGRNPGLLLLSEDHGSNRRMDSKRARPFLKRFKEDFPDWSAVPWSNSYVELTPTTIIIEHTRFSIPVPVGILNRNESGWQAKLNTFSKRTRVNPKNYQLPRLRKRRRRKRAGVCRAKTCWEFS